MKTKYDLLEMRDVWIDAYMNGDIDQLNFVESSHFFVKRRDRTVTKLQQISFIRQRLSENTWPDVGLRVHDEITEVERNRLWASISGTGSMRRGGRTLIRFDFLELWLINGGRWQIAALCYDEKEREGNEMADRRGAA
ncbi:MULTISPECIES: hypothetical protein [unclassified Burkholderia]|uniref:hypothetical protein n=1 Tax=unclassified Burkholderia TaxID=2613784 RepID=UPI000F57EBF9|nr:MULTISPECIES: hypothetical protein [unclassified Burkholderia]RQR34786.1 hypothetical protein DIE22_15960 [Burkholderia sp. Bp9142]RQR55463.1 hypothetical protein DIE21_05105 [Burkholderia sp. Bp9140]